MLFFPLLPYLNLTQPVSRGSSLSSLIEFWVILVLGDFPALFFHGIYHVITFTTVVIYRSQCTFLNNYPTSYCNFSPFFNWETPCGWGCAFSFLVFPQFLMRWLGYNWHVINFCWLISVIYLHISMPIWIKIPTQT